MLNFDNTVNYAPTFKKINESIESINTLLTSLLLDTYTNQTFIYSDINVIRVNTSQNYDSIQSLSGVVPLKLDSSVSTNFFMKTNSVQFASQSTMSDKMNVSDFDSVSGNYFMKSNSTIFASTSELSSKFNVSDSSQFALNSSVSEKIENKLDKTDFSIYSLDFASTSDLASKLDASESTYFLPSSDFTIPTFSAEYLSNLSNFMESSSDSFTLTFTNLMYNMIPTSFSDSALEINNQPLLYNLSLTGNLNATDATIRNFSISSGSLNVYNVSLQGTFNNNTIRNGNCTLNGIFNNNNLIFNNSVCISGDLYNNYVQSPKLDYYVGTGNHSIYSSNSFNVSMMNLIFPNMEKQFYNNSMHVNYFNAQCGDFSKCYFSLFSVCSLNDVFSLRQNTFEFMDKLHMNCNNIRSNTFNTCTSVKIKASHTTYQMRFIKNSFSQCKQINICDFKIDSNTFNNLTNVSLDVKGLYENSFNSIKSLSIKFPIDGLKAMGSMFRDNTFNNIENMVCDIQSLNDFDPMYWYSNSISANTVEFNIGYNVKGFNMACFIGLQDGKCSIKGLNINTPENNTITKDFINQIVWMDGYSQWSRYHLISFNSTNRWINSGFNDTLSSYCDYGLFAEHSDTTELDVQGSIFSTIIDGADLINANYYFQPKFSPNYDSIKHYMVLYSNSFRDYYEIDPNALEAGHNNNACENILLMKDYSFYSTLPISYTYTFIQWPSTRMTFKKTCFSNNTYLNTITELTYKMQQQHYTDFEYTVGKDGDYKYLSYRLSTSQLSSLVNTSSSSQVYAGFSTSGDVFTRNYIETLSR